MVKNLPAKTGDTRDLGSITGLGRFPGEGNGNPLQYSCLNTRTEEPGGIQFMGHKESDRTEQAQVCACTHTYAHF